MSKGPFLVASYIVIGLLHQAAIYQSFTETERNKDPGTVIVSVFSIPIWPLVDVGFAAHKLVAEVRANGVPNPFVWLQQKPQPAITSYPSITTIPAPYSQSMSSVIGPTVIVPTEPKMCEKVGSANGKVFWSCKESAQ